ncbi:hypothetical protein Hanom_Chr12g01138371 [Helianthus anomalus]
MLYQVRFAGYRHVAFVTLEALEVNGESLLDHAVKLDLAKEKVHTLPVPAQTPALTAFCKVI